MITITRDVLDSYFNTLGKLAAAAPFKPPSVTNVANKSPLESGQTAAPDIKMPTIKMKAGKPGKPRSISTPRPSGVKPTQPSQARDIRETGIPEVM